MIKPKRLQAGDCVALVSLSSGMAGDSLFLHRYEIGKRRLEEHFGLDVVTMPNALKGSDYLDRNPEARAQDWMDAFADDRIHGIISMIGGNDAIRLLPYVDFECIKNNPKIYMGYSDSTVNHFMMYQAGVISYYGPSLLAEFAENVAMHTVTEHSIRQTLFQPVAPLELKSSPFWTSQHLEWSNPQNDFVQRELQPETKGYELLQGRGVAEGALLGGCIDVFPALMGTSLFPDTAQWKDKIMFLETSEACIPPEAFATLLRGLAAMGVFHQICGLIVGKPQHETYYKEYKALYQKIIGQEVGRPELPILYNLNFGHHAPMQILPIGVQGRIHCEEKSFTLLENATL